MSAESGHPLFRFSRRNRPRDGRKIRRRPVFPVRPPVLRQADRLCLRAMRAARPSPDGRLPSGERRKTLFPRHLPDPCVPSSSSAGPPRSFAQERPRVFRPHVRPTGFGQDRKREIRQILRKGVETGKANAPRTTLQSRHPEPFSGTPRNIEQCPACVGHFFHAFPPG